MLINCSKHEFIPTIHQQENDTKKVEVLSLVIKLALPLQKKTPIASKAKNKYIGIYC